MPTSLTFDRVLVSWGGENMTCNFLWQKMVPTPVDVAISPTGMMDKISPPSWS